MGRWRYVPLASDHRRMFARQATSTARLSVNGREIIPPPDGRVQR
jgi:hypothetical protein